MSAIGTKPTSLLALPYMMKTLSLASAGLLFGECLERKAPRGALAKDLGRFGFCRDNRQTKAVFLAYLSDQIPNFFHHLGFRGHRMFKVHDHALRQRQQRFQLRLHDRTTRWNRAGFDGTRAAELRLAW